MEIKDNKLVLDIPKGMEVDIEKSDLKAGVIKFRKKKICYADVLSTLAYKDVYPADIKVPEMIAGKIIALARLMTIAKYYNGDWKPDWNSKEYKHNIMRTSEYGITSCDLLAELKKRLKISIFLWRKSCASRCFLVTL